MEDVELAGRELDRDEAGNAVLRQDEVEDVVLIEELDALLHALLEQRLQDHVPGPVRRVRRALHRGFAVVARVPTEPTLVDLAVGRAVEGQSHPLEVQHGVDRFATHDLDRVLVAEEVAAFDRVVRVPLPVVLFDVGQRRAHAALRRAGV